MEETQEDAGTANEGSSSSACWPGDLVRKIGDVSLLSLEEASANKELNNRSDAGLSSQAASQVLWRTGMFSGSIPNGFYSIIPEKRLKARYDQIPSLSELSALDDEDLHADIILVDAEKDKKLMMLKQLIKGLVIGLSANPAAIIKKIAGLVSDVYKRSNLESGPVKSLLEEHSRLSDSIVVQRLGQIKHGSCRPRAILFKVLADTVGLESSLMVGLPNDGVSECLDSYKHMSVIVVLNSVELLVDLMRFPGQLIPRTTRAIFMTHISAAGESDSAENDSCDSPLEPNSPLFGFSEKPDTNSVDREDALHYQSKLEASTYRSGLPLRGIVLRPSSSFDEKMSLSHSEPNIPTEFWRRSRRKGINEQRTASSSPEYPLSRACGRSLLSGDQRSFREYVDDMASSSCKSDGPLASDARRTGRRSFSMTPEISDDIVRAVRAMNETLKRRARDAEGNKSFPCFLSNMGANFDTQQEEQHHLNDVPGINTAKSSRVSCQKAVSLPSSPHEFMTASERNENPPEFMENEEMIATWNRVLESLLFNNKPLLPFQEWNIDFSELTVGTRVGIGFFGEVFRGMWNGTEVAIKVFLEQDLTAENMEDFCNEISILCRLRHPNVILFLGACTKPPGLSMVTEYMELGSLYYLIHLSGEKNKLSWRRRLKMIRDICRGLMCMHRMKIVHRDLKTANCLVNKHWTVKICDFGLSRIMAGSSMTDSSSAGTPEWMAPELIRNEPFTEKCDIFSLGVIMWELYTLHRPWDGVPPERVVYAVANEGSRLEIPQGPFGRLINDCWAVPDRRPTCEDILSRLHDCD